MKIIAFPYHDWRKGQSESFRTRDGHLLLEFGKDPSVEQVLIVDRPVSRAERLTRPGESFVRGSRIDEKRLGARHARLTSVGSKTVVLDIEDPALFAPVLRRRGWWFDVFDALSTQELIHWAVDEVAGQDAVVVAWVPTVAGAVDSLRPRRFVFDSLDNWITHPILRKNKREAIEGYRRIGGLATTVFVPAEASRDQLSPYIPHIEILPNGVDVKAFRTASPRPPDLPRPPVVGYLGKLGIRLNGPLIRDAALRLPDTHFVFVGPTLEQPAVEAFARLPNVTLLGDRRYEDVPAYLTHFDVAWIPHRVGEGETGGDLIKKYEYWAAGRQVVSTGVGGIDQWANQIHLANDAESMAATIRGILTGTIPLKPTDIPPDRTWSAIAGRILQALD